MEVIMINDKVNHPKHYQNGMHTELECIMFTRNLSFCLGNAFKYVWRSGEKVTETLDTDVRKAIWYLKDAVEHNEPVPPQEVANLVDFLPKNQLVDWKFNTLACILKGKLLVAIQTLTDGLETDTAS
jgi:hypothetical protein